MAATPSAGITEPLSRAPPGRPHPSRVHSFAAFFIFAALGSESPLAPRCQPDAIADEVRSYEKGCTVAPCRSGPCPRSASEGCPRAHNLKRLSANTRTADNAGALCALRSGAPLSPRWLRGEREIQSTNYQKKTVAPTPPAVATSTGSARPHRGLRLPAGSPGAGRPTGGHAHRSAPRGRASARRYRGNRSAAASAGCGYRSAPRCGH